MVRKVRTLAVVVGAAVMLTGCGTKLAGNAAVIGDVTISESVISDLVNEVRLQIEDMPKGDTGQTPSLVMLNQMILSHLVLENVIDVGLAAQGITVTDAQVSSFKESVFAQYGQETIERQVALQQGVSAAQLDSFMRLVLSEQLLAEALAPGASADEQTQALIAFLGEVGRRLDVSIAPRFGAWNPNKLQVTPGDMTLSQPAPVSPAS